MKNISGAIEEVMTDEEEDGWDAIEFVVCRRMQIRVSAEDPERAHALEDGLHQAVLELIAAGVITGEEAMEVARLALTTEDIDFPRRYA